MNESIHLKDPTQRLVHKSDIASLQLIGILSCKIFLEIKLAYLVYPACVNGCEKS